MGVMARPTKLTPEISKRICEAIRIGATRLFAAEYADIDESTFYRWIERGNNEESGPFHEFCKALKRAEAEGVVTCLSRIQSAAVGKIKENGKLSDYKGQWQAAAWILERRHPKEYGKQIVFDDDASKRLADAIENLKVKDE